MKNKKLLALKFPRRDRRFKLTSQGKRYALLILAVLIAALNTGNNLLYLILAFMLSSIALSRLIVPLYNKKIRISSRIPEAIYAGRQFLMVIKIENNKKWLPTCPQVLRLSNGIELFAPPFIPQVEPGAQLQCKLFHTFESRGIYKLKNLIGQSTFPLGIFEHFTSLPLQEEEIIVYPKIKPLKDFYLNGSEGHKALESFITKGNFSLYNIRDYIPGDEARFLHWKASAKLSKLMVKEFLQEEQKKISILLDTGFPDELDSYKRERFEDRVSLAASLLYYFISHDYSVRLVTSHHEIPFGWGALHLHNMLKHLAVVEADCRGKPDLVELKLREPISPYSLSILISYQKELVQLFSGRSIWNISHCEAVP